MLSLYKQGRHTVPKHRQQGRVKRQTAVTIKTSGYRQEKDTASLKYPETERIHQLFNITWALRERSECSVTVRIHQKGQKINLRGQKMISRIEKKKKKKSAKK